MNICQTSKVFYYSRFEFIIYRAKVKRLFRFCLTETALLEFLIMAETTGFEPVEDF
jgi:hypothetical protein